MRDQGESADPKTPPTGKDGLKPVFEAMGEKLEELPSTELVDVMVTEKGRGGSRDLPSGHRGKGNQVIAIGEHSVEVGALVVDEDDARFFSG